MNDLDAKLETFDKHAQNTVQDLIDWLVVHGDDLIAMARGRHVEGHYRFGEQGLFEYDVNHLKAEMAQELADAIVYGARRKYLLSQSEKPVEKTDDPWVAYYKQTPVSCCGDPGDCGDCQ